MKETPATLQKKLNTLAAAHTDQKQYYEKEAKKLKRENTRLHNANVRLNITVSNHMEDAARLESLDEEVKDLRGDNYSLKQAKNKIVEEGSNLKRTVSSLVGEKEQLEAVLKHIQGDIRVVSEVLYGQEFDPSNIDKLMPMMSNGIEYVPKASVESVGPYVEPVQHLLRIIWRHTYWGLNPFSSRDFLYGETPR